jgi:Flp pilus assembly protein protease CpaA
MIVLEAALVLVLLFTMCIASATDIASGRILNSHLAMSALCASAISIPYYVLCPELLPVFLVNLMLVTLMALVLYSSRIWAAGDSKLLLVITLCVPARLYTFFDVGLCPGFITVAGAFISSLIYVLIESLVSDIKKRQLELPHIAKPDFVGMGSSCIFMAGLTTMCNYIISVMPSNILNDHSLSIAISFMLIVMLQHIKDQIQTKTILLIGILSWITRVFIGMLFGRPLPIYIEVETILITLLYMVVTAYASRYNYETIPVTDVRAGQILSIATVIDFDRSRVAGLPRDTTEDMGSRITEKEAKAIQRWSTSKYGKQTVTIVRKMPFAIFISLGMVLTLALEVFMKWH